MSDDLDMDDFVRSLVPPNQYSYDNGELCLSIGGMETFTKKIAELHPEKAERCAALLAHCQKVVAQHKNKKP